MKNKIRYPYNPKLKERARYLRNHSTLAEVLLWKHLRDKQMMGYDFDRQKPIDKYIIDFFCDEIKLAIEIDGNSHKDNAEKDEERQIKIEQFGIRFLRFTDLEVKKNMRSVLHTIEGWIEKNKKHSSTKKDFGVSLDYNYMRDPFE